MEGKGRTGKEREMINTLAIYHPPGSLSSICLSSRIYLDQILLSCNLQLLYSYAVTSIHGHPQQKFINTMKKLIHASAAARQTD